MREGGREEEREGGEADLVVDVCCGVFEEIEHILRDERDAWRCQV